MNDEEEPTLSPLAAIAALLGLGGLILPILGLIALILALLGMIHISQSKGEYRGHVLCLLGTILGAISALAPLLLREFGSGKF